LAKCCRIVGLGEPLARYRVHHQNTVANTAKWCESRLALTRKHFGDPRDSLTHLSAQQRRAHAYAYRAAAIKCLQDNADDQGWQYLRQSASIWPEILSELGTAYELICGNQAPGLRGDATRLNLSQREAYMRERLNGLFRKAEADVIAQQKNAISNTYLALAMLSDQSANWDSARRYLFKSLRTKPSMISQMAVLRRLLKVLGGGRIITAWRNIRAGSSAAVGTKYDE